MFGRRNHGFYRNLVCTRVTLRLFGVNYNERFIMQHERDTMSTRIEEKCARTLEFSELSEGRTPRTQPSVETKQKEYAPRVTRGCNCNVQALLF